ncbi:ABC transporter permease [Nigerium massiliense]|uniref:ABC transporter permease n=1 Tax=Nigerium massiliense TaxID=1522317 RepID=UPI000AAD6D0C|nr:ABC transporter permease [Nigerium massiliense]
MSNDNTTPRPGELPEDERRVGPGPIDEDAAGSGRDERVYDDGEMGDRILGDDPVRGGAAPSGPLRTAEAADGDFAVEETDAHGRGEGVGQAKEVEGLSQSQIVWRRFIRHRGAIFGLVTLTLVALLSILAMGLGPIPGLWPFQDYMRPNNVVNGGSPTLQIPGIGGATSFAIGEHPFGQDDIGRDSFALVMKGVQTSLFVMFCLSFIALVIGVTIGSLAGYFRGRLDQILMRFTDLVITLPVIVLGAVLGKLVGILPIRFNATPEQTLAITNNMPLLLSIALGCILWTGLARLVRSEFMSLREREFVDAARVAGASNWRIITKHMLPNAVGVIIVNTTLLMSSAVTLEAALSFLNFGILPPNISLGWLISVNQGAFATRPWLFWWPGVFIILLALSVNFIGDGLRDAFDPRMRKIPSARKMAKAAAQLEPAGGATAGSGATAAGASRTTEEETK